jgi:ATP-binding cassette, subfamily G (WHITE), member 2, SNQ2
LFSFALASASPTPTTAAHILPFLLAIMAIVNGIIVPHMQMTNPWRDFVYWVNPLVSVLLASSDAEIEDHPYST